MSFYWNASRILSYGSSKVHFDWLHEECCEQKRPGGVHRTTNSLVCHTLCNCAALQSDYMVKRDPASVAFQTSPSARRTSSALHLYDRIYTNWDKLCTCIFRTCSGSDIQISETDFYKERNIYRFGTRVPPWQLLEAAFWYLKGSMRFGFYQPQLYEPSGTINNTAFPEHGFRRAIVQ